MKNQIIISFADSKKYNAVPPDYQGCSMMIDIIGDLIKKTCSYGELQTTLSTIKDGKSFQVLKIPEILDIKLVEDPVKQTLTIRYSVPNNDATVQTIIDDVSNTFIEQ